MFPAARGEARSTKSISGCGALILWALLSVLDCLPISVPKAYGFQVCARTCRFGDAACVAAVAACQTKLHAYNIYMNQMGAGVTTFALPAVYQEILRAFYPRVDLSLHRFGFSDRQPPNNATTDCNRTYYNNPKYVEQLRTAAANPNWFWVLHELVHPEQCAEAAGREGYAKRWWDELDAALAAQGLKVDVSQPPEALAQQLGSLYAQVHDMMPMEIQATNKANKVLKVLNSCCRAADDTPIRPLALTGIEDRSDGGSSRRILKAEVANGDPPFTSRWWVKDAGRDVFVEQPPELIRGLELLWTPANHDGNAQVVNTAVGQSRQWKHEVRVEVAQRSASLVRQTFSRTFTFSERITINLQKSGPRVEKLPLELPPAKAIEIPLRPAPGKPGAAEPAPRLPNRP